MKVTVTDHQREAHVDRGRIASLARFFMAKVSKRHDRRPWGSVNIVLADDKLIAEMNQRFLRHEGPTDVITFSYAMMPGTGSETHGEIVVNVERAWRVGPRHGGAARELALYVAHGCDHLGGADDATLADRQRMRARENRWLRVPRARDLYRGAIEGGQHASRTRP